MDRKGPLQVIFFLKEMKIAKERLAEFRRLKK